MTQDGAGAHGSEDEYFVRIESINTMYWLEKLSFYVQGLSPRKWCPISPD